MKVIEADNISKLYIIDHQKTKGRLSMTEQLGKSLRFWEKENSTIQEEFWALKDVNFSINQGDRMGIVGSNGAGKSTLLKILSRITDPTQGSIRIKGRVASLLEVGTGFHPELSGRENIFLNGAILGMNQDEIRRQFDAIVDFGGIEKFLDTPVKRYSSGMYVRLGFAIAAHLSPEILIVDEVLAVGDADFQKKSLGKMKDVSASGRTLIFVSHNMTAVQGLCNKAIFLQHGRLMDVGDTDQVINHYLAKVKRNELSCSWDKPAEGPGNDQVRFKSFKVVPEYADDNERFDVRAAFKVQVEFWNLAGPMSLNLSLHLNSVTGETVFNVGTQSQRFEAGLITAELKVPGHWMNDGSYSISCMIVKDTSTVLFEQEEALMFDIEDFRENVSWYGKWPGLIRPTSLPFAIQQMELIENF
jgi:lipopolysaccharide transport system ATP-binding protein